ncbi:PVC-type heme-binding CxxCH protein [Singulisphaera sp. PoT]|uniref:PVC-type heme-binding CxxCH protein n=1 Tax=Singulisphaera sp. PoT TaxID=3411797 RepID=UPI003BF497A1
MNRKQASTLVAWGFLALCPSLFAQRELANIPDPDPELERRSFQVAEGFEVNLFAADPILAKPIQMNFDPAGRLWIVSSEVYPQIKPGQTANDKVLILEDKDGDGRADSTSVFADGLLIPTGIEPGDGGAYVANSTELLHFSDTDKDGKADSRRVMLSGFGTEDTHHILHTLRWGFDGQLYFNQSIYIHSHIETPHGTKRLGGGGIWEFRPETMELDVFIKGLVNPWGHHFDRWGQSFATDGAGGEGINYCLPGAYYVTAPNAPRILKGLNPGSPKYCGEEVVNGRHLPDSWQGNIITNDFRGNRVCRFVISDDGAGFAAREQGEVIKTSHVAFRPIDVKVGPDGAIYIADWYNPIIQHGEVDFRDPRRDHTRGRIWRVTAKGRPLVTRPKLVDASTEQLLAALKEPEDWTRHHAKRVLKERGASVLPALAAWVKALDPKDGAQAHQRLEALWTYQSLDVVEPDLLKDLLRDADPRIRAAATRVLAHWLQRVSDPLDLLAAQVVDDHPRVRLEGVRALARIPNPRAAEIAMRALDLPVDRFLDYALYLTARELEPVWLPEVQAGRFDFGGHSSHLVFALRAVGSPAVVKPLAQALEAGKIPKDNQDSALTVIASLGEPKDLAMVFDLALNSDKTQGPRQAALLGALLKATQQRKVRPEGDLNRVGKWLDGDDQGLKAIAARAAGLWQVKALRPKVVSLATAEATPDAVRREAIDALVAYKDPESLQTLSRLAAQTDAPRTQLLAIGALASVDIKAGATQAVGALSHTKNANAVSDLVGRILQLKEGSSALVAALSGKTLPPDAAKLAVRAARNTGKDETPLIEALSKAGGLSSQPQPLTTDELAKLVGEVRRDGNAARGEAIFRRQEQACLKCHAIAGAGGQVGPSLESVGASAQVDYLIDSLLLPNKAVKENYHSAIVATSDGKVISGIKVRQTDRVLILRDAEDQEIEIPLDTIDEQKNGGSLMPTGLTESLTHAEFVDLVRFLSELGKIGPYSVGKTRVARRWRVAQATPEAASVIQKGDLDAAIKSGSSLTWNPAYSLVSGTLPLDAFQPVAGKSGKVGLASTVLDVSTAGSVKIGLNSPANLTLWVDGNKVEPKTDALIELSAGLHTFTVLVDLEHRQNGVQFTLDEVADSKARAQWVVGK